jgi:hypothetical protein
MYSICELLYVYGTMLRISCKVSLNFDVLAIPL